MIGNARRRCGIYHDAESIGIKGVVAKGVLFSEKGDGEGEPRTPGKERGKGKAGE